MNNDIVSTESMHVKIISDGWKTKSKKAFITVIQVEEYNLNLGKA